MKPLGNDPHNHLRLQTFLSRNGVCSRREAMRVVQSGRVSVDGLTVTEPSTPIDPAKNVVAVDGKRVEYKIYTYIMLNKPSGYVTTKTKRFGESIVFDLLPNDFQHLVPVGRLDKNTKGLLLLTNDGQLAFELTHPKFDVDKKYFVRVKGMLSAEQIRRLENGVIVEGEKTLPAKVSAVKNNKGSSEFILTIHEGRKRQIRLMAQSVGHYVIELIRLEHGPVKLGPLKEGAWRLLSNQEIAQLKLQKEAK